MVFQRKEYHKEENCLNCGYPLIGKFCGNCGQKAFLRKDSFLKMAAHFIADYFHYDNKFWKTLKVLFTRPGLVTLEYNEGRRVKYLKPIQFYVFVTTIYFFLVFSIQDKEGDTKKVNTQTVKTADTLVQVPKRKSSKNGVLTFREKSVGIVYDINNDTFVVNTLQEYDSIQKVIEPAYRDNFLKKYLKRKIFIYDEKYPAEGSFNQLFFDKIRNNFTKIFFLLLPYFALLLLLVNIRRKQYYIDHIIFSLHFHSLLFIILSICHILEYFTGRNIDFWLYVVAFSGIGVYLFIALKRVYPGGFFNIFWKQTFLFFGYLIGFIISLLIYLLLIFANM